MLFSSNPTENGGRSHHFLNWIDEYTIRSIVRYIFLKPVENLFYNKTYKQQKNNSIAVRWFCCFKLSPSKDDGLSTAQD